MSKQCRVLLTGAGSGVGQSIFKALRLSNLPVTIIAADISPMNAALYVADESVIIPRIEEPKALETIIDLLLKYRIDVVMIGSEFELEFFSVNKEKIESCSKAIIIVAPPATVAISNDKWLTTEFLRANKLPYAEAYLPKNQFDAKHVAESWGYPVILKTRCGTSSRHVHVIEDSNHLNNVLDSIPMAMLQRVIDIPTSELGSEYTCSVFKTKNGEIIGPFTARRTVRGGTSWHIEVSSFKKLHPTLLAIANSLDFIGSLNIQLMLTEQGAIPFELNSRFSGTTAVRAHFGFNEPAMALYSFFYNEAIPLPQIHSGIAMRYHEEVFIDNISSKELTPGIHKGSVFPWF